MTTIDHDRTRTNEHHTLVGLIRELRDESSLLLRQEVALARREFMEKFELARNSTIAMLVGGLMAGAGGLFVLLAASFGLTEAFIEMGMARDVAVWVGPLVVGLVVAIAGLATLMVAKSRFKKEHMAPNRTIESIEETGRWAREKVREL